jgi:hypothetical protein
VKVIIAGSRTIGRHERDYAFADELVRMGIRIARLRGLYVAEVVCGEADGIDKAGKRWAIKNGVPVKSFEADWGQFGKKAGYLRNEQMGEYGEGLIAITTGSQGTRNMIQIARGKNMPVIVIEIP